MCGIAGWLAAPGAHLSADVLQAMQDSIQHRGPDGEGSHIAETRDSGHQVALGHRRLSIIDLATGDQPMQDPSERLTVVFNGEIYNFQDLREQLTQAGFEFSTTSDTEVLVHGYLHWGEDMVERLRGQFAFAIWDAEEESLLLARDHFGLKPFYLTEQEGRILFASEVKAILQVPDIEAEVELDAVWSYLTYRYVPGPTTLFQGIRKLPPGHCARWRSGEFTQWRYHTPPDALARPSSPLPDDVVTGFLERLDEAVRIRMVSDVPYGAFLSGGIDSSAIVALMSRHSEHPVQTFSVGFSEAEYSELGFARQVAAEFGCAHTELVVSPDDMMQWLPDLIRLRDAPVAEPSDIPIHLLSLKAAESVKMVLTGEGSDEFLGGYEKHTLERPAWWYRLFVPGLAHRFIAQPLVRSLPYSFHRWKTAMTNVGLRDHHERMPRWHGALSWRERERLCSLEGREEVGDGACLRNQKGNTLLRRMLHFDQASWLPDHLLERGDRMSMGASIEARMPFMDHQLAAWVSSLPDRYRVRRFTTKWILRQAMKEVLPEAMLTRPKVGFRVPVNEWFRDSMHDWLRDQLTGPDSQTSSYYHRERLEQVLDEHARGRQNHEKTLWTLLNLELVHRSHF